MTALNTTLVQDFTRNYQNSARTIHGLVDPLSDEQIWTRPYPYGNSIGNLVLHLCGNVRQWIVSGIGGKPDVRVRDREFSAHGDVRADEGGLAARFPDESDRAFAAVCVNVGDDDAGTVFGKEAGRRPPDA